MLSCLEKKRQSQQSGSYETGGAGKGNKGYLDDMVARLARTTLAQRLMLGACAAAVAGFVQG